MLEKSVVASASAARCGLEVAAGRARADAELATRIFGARGTALVGLQLGYAASLSAHAQLPFVLEGLFGRSELSDGSGRIGVMNLYSITAGCGVRWRTLAQPSLELGPRLMLGAGLADPGSLRAGAKAAAKQGFLMTALIDAVLRAPLSRALLASLGVDLGYTVFGIVFLGDQARLAGMADATLGAHAGLAW